MAFRITWKLSARECQNAFAKANKYFKFFELMLEEQESKKTARPIERVGVLPFEMYSNVVFSPQTVQNKIEAKKLLENYTTYKLDVHTIQNINLSAGALAGAIFKVSANNTEVVKFITEYSTCDDFVNTVGAISGFLGVVVVFAQVVAAIVVAAFQTKEKPKDPHEKIRKLKQKVMDMNKSLNTLRQSLNTLQQQMHPQPNPTTSTQ